MRDVCPHTTVNLKRIIFGSLCVCVRVSSTIGRFHLCTHARQRKRFLIFCPDVPHYLWLIVRHALNEQEQEEEKASLSATSKSGLDLATVFSFLPMWKLICAHVSWFQGISSFMSPNPFSRNASLLEMWAIIYWVAKNRFWPMGEWKCLQGGGRIFFAAHSTVKIEGPPIIHPTAIQFKPSMPMIQNVENNWKNSCGYLIRRENVTHVLIITW